MENYIQRETFNAKRDSLSYPEIPDYTEFFTGYGYEKPETIHGFQWSTTFNQWGALVTFKSGQRVFTWGRA